MKTFSNADNRDVIYDFLTHLHTHRVDFHTSLRHLSEFNPNQSTPEQISQFTEKMLRASLSNPKDEQIKEAAKDFEPYLTRFSARIQQPEEVSAWEETTIPDNDRGIELIGGGSGWEEKRRTDMKRHNPKFVLRQWVLEELISKLEESGVERIEDGRKDLAKVLDVSIAPFLRCPIFYPGDSKSCMWGILADSKIRCPLDHSSIGIRLGPRKSDYVD